ncbi:MAG TPA: sigma-54 dependent transcriptional regulator [Bryobacteraceae bacterium]|nr:sigma-54 dependent transcriptional regulator [Bryobacteraceae bacterium]
MQFKALCIGSLPENSDEPLPREMSYSFRRDPVEALQQLHAESFDLLLARFPMGEWTPEMLLENIFTIARSCAVVIAKPGASVEEAVRLVKLGAAEVVDDAGVGAACQRALQDLREQLPPPKPAVEPWRRLLVGSSLKMQRIVEVIRLVASRKCTVLITGETGTGKEVIARAIHAAGNRADSEMVCVNCNAVPETLLEAELFGHVKGAFTGAFTQRIGLFEQAHRGTLFLDEIGDMPLGLQPKLLRVLQEREFQKLGSSETIKVDVRVIAATNADLAQKMREGKFREDLYYRLNVVPMDAPPLRARPGDIPLLTTHFVEKICREEGIPVKKAPGELLDRLSRCDWPGNVRQLENAVEMAVALSGDREMLFASDFQLAPTIPLRRMTAGDPMLVAVPDHGLDFEQIVGSIERNILEQALQKTGGNKKAAAQMLRLKRTTLAAKWKTLTAGAAV